MEAAASPQHLRVRKALRKGGRLFIDGGNPLREITHEVA